MKKFSVLLAVFLLCFAGQAFGLALPYEYELDKQIKESETFEISFKDAAEVRFKLTIELLKDWEKGDDFLYYLLPDGTEIEVFSSNDDIASDAFSFILKVPFFKYTEGDVLQLYSDVTTNGKFIVTNLTNTIVPEPATMLLLGVGLMGLAGLGRKKLFRKK